MEWGVVGIRQGGWGEVTLTLPDDDEILGERGTRRITELVAGTKNAIGYLKCTTQKNGSSSPMSTLQKTESNRTGSSPKGSPKFTSDSQFEAGI